MQTQVKAYSESLAVGGIQFFRIIFASFAYGGNE